MRRKLQSSTNPHTSLLGKSRHKGKEMQSTSSCGSSSLLHRTRAGHRSRSPPKNAVSPLWWAQTQRGGSQHDLLLTAVPLVCVYCATTGLLLCCWCASRCCAIGGHWKIPATLSMWHTASTVPETPAVEATREGTGCGNAAAEAAASIHTD